MQRRKSRTSIVVDELALAKSAAWAWYSQGSGSEGKPIREFDASRTKIDPKPSRYKLEAMRNVQETSNPSLRYYTSMPSPRSTTTSRRASTNSLLDEYEIDSISRQLVNYIESSHVKYQGGILKSKKIVSKGFWLRSNYGAVCGSSRGDVAESAITRLGSHLWRRPEKGQVAVAEIVGCRPRKGIRV